MINRRRFLMIAAMGASPFPLIGMQKIAPAQPAQEHEISNQTAEPKQERKLAREFSNPLIIINPGHFKNSGANLGVYVAGIGHEYIINTQISSTLHRKLQEIGLQATVTRDEQNYLPAIVDYMADHNTRLQTEYDAYIRETKKRRHRELGRREAILQLGIMRYAESREAAVMIDIHVDDQMLRKRKRRRPEAKGFSVILNKTASGESNLLQSELCSALRKTVPLNRCYHMKNERRGIFMLGNNELPFSVPSCLVECGFMRQPYVIEGETKHICDPEVQDMYASALAQGLANYLGSSRSVFEQ
jgi:N-acetylmuramoyl-L-alanine amidase